MYAIYARTRIEALYDPTTACVTIPRGPGEGIYKSPSGTSTAVLRALRPDISPVRDGWTFWRLASSGGYLRTLRPTARIGTSPGTPAMPTAPVLPATPRR
ncbi:hypothetical protein ACFYN0_01385 [Streptomyces sp. NPDC006704]|uniref:hypothetical protein n=1 Tax=Streptomyces sp. NPDC006704 TaxID=3364760 RepID=UPI0036781D3B